MVSEAIFFSLRQLAIFSAFVFQTHSVLKKAESFGIKLAAWLVCSNTLLDFYGL